MDTDRELSRKLVRSTIAEYEKANAGGDAEVIAAMHDVHRAAYEIETRFEKREIAATTAMLAIVTTEQRLYTLALEQNKREPDEESYVWRLHLGRRFAQVGLVPLREDLMDCRALASHLGDRDAAQQADAMLASLPV